MPKCPNCQSSGFTMMEITPVGSNFKYNAICCISCQSVVGIVDFYNTASLLETLAKKLGFDIFR